MSGRAITWSLVAVAAALFIWWQYSNYAHNNKLNSDLGNRTDVNARVAAASELIDKKQFGDVLPTTPEYVHERVIPALETIASDTSHRDRYLEALNQLVALMKDADEGVRYRAQQALIRLGMKAVPKEADKGVIPALKDGDAHAKKGAIAVLDAIGPATIPALVNAVKADKDERGSAVDALVGLAPAPTPQVLTLLNDKDAVVQSAAANYFGNTALVPGKAQTAGEAKLLVLLTKKDVRPAAMRAEGLLHDPRALPEILKALTSPADAGNRRVAIVALGDLKALGAIPNLIPFLKDPDPDIQSVSVVALRSMGPAGTGDLETAFASPDPVIRKGIAGSLQGATWPQATALLTRALHDPDAAVRQAAASSLGAPGSTAAVDPLIAALSDPSPDVAETAQASLVVIGAPAVQPLVSQFSHAAMPSSEAAAIPSSAAGESLRKNVVVPYYASHALALIGAPAADAVMAAAQTGSTAEREWALVTLSDLRVPKARPVLQSIARTADPTIRWFAQDALRKYPTG